MAADPQNLKGETHLDPQNLTLDVQGLLEGFLDALIREQIGEEHPQPHSSSHISKEGHA